MLNFQTNIISGVTSNWSGTYFVGDTNANDALIIQSGGVLYASVDGGLGATPNSSNNFVLVTGPGSLWNMPYGYLILSGEDYCCDAGPGNRMVISNGGVVASYHGYIGGYVFNSAGSNSVLVSDPGSAWKMPGQFAVGDGSTLNSLVISNGAVVYNFDGYMGYSSGSGFNSAWVTGTGSVWSNGAGLEIGSYGGPNTLTILDGGLVTANYGSIGPRTSSNAVIVSGVGSVWSNQNDVTVGGFGSGNTLVISNGGSLVASNLCIGTVGAGSYGINPIEGPVGEGTLVFNGGSITVGGFFATNSSSQVTFSGGFLSAWQTKVSNGPVFPVGDGLQTATFHMLGGTNSFASNLWIRTNALLTGCATVYGVTLVDGTLLADCGGTFTFGGTITNNGTVEVRNGTSLDLYGPVVNNGLIIATNGMLHGYSTFQNHGTLLGVFQDMHDVWTNSSGGRWEGAANWSQGAPTNKLWCVITNQSSKVVTIDASTASSHPETLAVNALTLGAQTGVTNALSLSNPGIGVPLRIQNSVTVSPGGILTISNGAMQIGVLSGRSLDIDGEISMVAAALTSSNGLTSVGATATGQMTVSNSTVASGDVCVGCAAGSSGTLTVTGAGSTWSNSATVYIGQAGMGNQLVVVNGGELVSGYGHIGYGSASSNNNAVIAGSGSVWSNLYDLSVGRSGAGNGLVISSGGAVYSGNGYVGSNMTSIGNSALVTDAGSVWSNQFGLVVGWSGAGNSLILSNGGCVFSSYFKPTQTNHVGYASGGNRVLVSGTGSVWIASGQINIGYGGAGNSMAISNGGQVAGSVVILGVNTGSTNNSALVTGTGSVWSNSGSLCVGYSGTGNSLTITTGGRVFDSAAYLGYNAGSSNNNVVLAGSSAAWYQNGGVFVGFSGGSNSLVLANGGLMVGGREQVASYLGFNLGSSNNTALVTGTGTIWSNFSSLYVGASGFGNSLVISNGARVSNLSTVLGSATFSGNNTVLITGTGSVLSNLSSMYVGQGGSSNSLMVDTGGQVVNNTGYVGYSSTSSNNSARVAGGGVWQNKTLYVGYQGVGNIIEVGGGSVFASNLVVGFASSGCGNNILQLDSGAIIVTNAAHTAVLEVRDGTLILNGGTLQIDTLVMTNPCSLLVRNSGAVIVGTLVLDPNLSALGDGIPNGWKQRYGFDPLDPTVARADPDDDGFSNLQEYLVGTDPTNTASSFHIISVLPSGSNLLVTWMMGNGRTNALQATSGDASGGYDANNFADIFIVTNTAGTTTNYLDMGSATKTPSRFYRVRLVP